MKITAKTDVGGAVILNTDHNVWVSYAVATAGDLPPSEILHANVALPDGRQVQFFCNRETGLVVVDVVDKNDKGGVEVYRCKV